MYQKFFLLSILLSTSFSAISDMKIEITHGVNTAYPIAVVPFSTTYMKHNNILNNNNNIENIGSIIAADLRNSGKFNTLPISFLPHQPSKLSDIVPMFWKKLGINTIVLGSINIDCNDNYLITYQLIDTSSNPALIILENQYLIKKKYTRCAAHTISNEIFEKLTGIKGAFCTRIAYVSYIHNTKYPYELYVADYDGYNQISICRSAEPLMSPAWTPDGKKIAYVAFSSGHSELVVQTLGTGLINHIIKFPNHNGAPAFSPDGEKLAFSSSKTGSLNLYVMYLSSGKICQITSNRHNNTEPSWFPDNTNLAYTSDQGGIPQIYKININNIIDNQRISWLPGSNQKPNISSDGNFIIMVNRYKGQQNISKLDLLTEKEEILTKRSFLADTPSIAPNEIMIIYSSILKKSTSVSIIHDNDENNEKSVLELISVDGHFKANLKGASGSLRFPVWSSSSWTCPKK
ncbi:protein TolB [Candidatus Blochmanniella vafra str. BVAF]|uniref:Tol-Pal system protein TolB n=1 Tax=Blochmanniella vafra (strain BVAF) TaxID=859654 RepID=E8Q6Y7_BLOVB|nr:Tol-Pal system beta propeller repeat protein TolB [Candidatus Blochmannia vafer]ADV33734.1 protein TolB [Candidatus Blochmannia vafer str. BVAF]